MTGNLPMVEMLLSKGCHQLLNRNDYITGFTPFHIALFIQNRQLLWYLVRCGVDIMVKDEFNATAMDYARLLGSMPHKFEKNLDKKTIAIFNPEQKQVEFWPVPKMEQAFNIKWCPYPKCGLYYIEELLFSGFAVGEKDMEFREKYKIIWETSGDENLIVSKVDDKVGYGVFAKRDFKEGDFIVRYGGFVEKEESVTNRDYSMTSGVEGIILDATKYRNLGGFINHSDKPNAEATCIFDVGVEQTIIIALEDIPQGAQILIDYSKHYFDEEQKQNFVDLTGTPLLAVSDLDELS